MCLACRGADDTNMHRWALCPASEELFNEYFGTEGNEDDTFGDRMVKTRERVRRMCRSRGEDARKDIQCEIGLPLAPEHIAPPCTTTTHHWGCQEQDWSEILFARLVVVWVFVLQRLTAVTTFRRH